MAFLGCLLSAVALLLTPHSLTGRIQYLCRRVFGVPLGIGHSLALAAQASQTRPSTVDVVELERLKAETQQLRNHIANLQAQRDEQQRRIDYLSGLRSRPGWERMIFEQAGIVTALDADHLILNRGTRDGLTLNRFVISSNAVVGIVQELWDRQARMALISGQDTYVQVYIGSPGVKGILHGLGQGAIEIQNVPTGRKVAKGMTVYASPQAGLEAPTAVGTVLSCEPDEREPLLWRIEVQPAVDLTQLIWLDVIVANGT